MNIRDALIETYARTRANNITMSSFIALLAVIDNRFFKDISTVTGLHEHTVTNVLMSLRKQGLIFRYGRKPYAYMVSASGGELIRNVLKKKKSAGGEERLNAVSP